jgi:hypothetical protein
VEIQGLTPIDTLYEFAGYAMSLTLGKYLIWNGYLLGFLLAAAVVRLYHQGAREGSFTDLAVYPVYVLFILFLMWPIEVSLTAPLAQTGTFLEETNPENGILWDPSAGVGGGLVRPDTQQVPRVLAYVSALAGAFQRNMTSDICDGMHGAMFEWKHIAAINSNTRIFSRSLREDLGVYLKCCYYPALIQDKNRDPDPWKIVPFAQLPIDDWLLSTYQAMNLSAEETHHFADQPSSCTDLHFSLNSDLAWELGGNKFHASAQAAYERLANRTGAGTPAAWAYAQFYRRRLVYNEIFIRGESSAATMRAALPDYSALDLKYITADSNNQGRGSNFLRAAKKVPAAAAAIASAVTEGWSQKAMGPATYYRVSAMGPYIYGLLLALLILIFPIAGLLAFWPGWWTALVNFMKLFVSIKLWPVFWAFLSGMLEYRSAFTPDDPEGFQGTFGSEGMFPALAIMYLVVPVFSFMITSLAQHAGGAILGSLLAQGQGASLGSTIGAVVQPGAAVGRAVGGSLGGGGGAAAPPRGGRGHND